MAVFAPVYSVVSVSARCKVNNSLLIRIVFTFESLECLTPDSNINVYTRVYAQTCSCVLRKLAIHSAMQCTAPASEQTSTVVYICLCAGKHTNKWVSPTNLKITIAGPFQLHARPVSRPPLCSNNT